jgi:hypothetical protein
MVSTVMIADAAFILHARLPMFFPTYPLAYSVHKKNSPCEPDQTFLNKTNPATLYRDFTLSINKYTILYYTSLIKKPGA